MTTKTEVAVVETKSVLIDMSNRYGMEPQAFEGVVRATCMKPDRDGRVPSREEFAAFLLVAKEYHLNPLTKEIYAYAAKGGGIVPIVSVDGWVNLVNSHKACDGFKFVVEHDEKGNLFSSTCIMYRKDRAHPVEVTEYLSECIRTTEPWKMKNRMLRHKSFIQAARYAFGFSGIYDEDEGEKIANSGPVPVDPNRDAAPPKRAQVEHQTKLAAGAHLGDGKGSHISGDPVDDIPASQQVKDKVAKKDEATDVEYREVDDDDGRDGSAEDGANGDAGSSMDDEPAKPSPARLVYERGMQTDAFTEAYLKALAECTEVQQVYQFIDLNRKYIDIVAQKDSVSDRKLRTGSDRIMKEVRDKEVAAMPAAGEKPKPKPKADPISSGVPKREKAAEKPADDKPPKRTTKAQKDAAVAPPVDPEEILKTIAEMLDDITDPDLFEDEWSRIVLEVNKLDFPGDKAAAEELYGKAQKRLGL